MEERATDRTPWIAMTGDRVDGFAPHDAVHAAVDHAAAAAMDRYVSPTGA